ncbi:hypothetical protein B5S28_g1793 [[Candida] boidinii]|nr:hypothetical protein B5S28_g1793 [[Candida] boidinii]OWB60504.1 hypothetical protein B5S29_g1378 [[Candida] boidinii]OWB76452.1 hypothetical protein B5S32_g604 [[Candida] boidinii]
MVSDTIRAELIYENYPIIAGTDEFSVILRLRYVGDLPMDPPAPKQDHSEEQKQQQQKQKQATDDNNSSWSRRISSQFSNATRAMFLQDLENISEEASEQEDNRLNDISLFLGYTQVFGYYVVNKQIIDFEIFKDLQASSIIGGKLAGISGLEVAGGKNGQSKGLFNGVSNLFNTEITSLGDKDFGEEEDNFKNLNLNSILSSKKGSNDAKSNAEVIPLYTTTQSILFSDITFKLSEYSQSTTSQDELCRTFYLNLKLPESLPPSFESPSTSIQYSFILGCQLQDLKTGKLENKTLIFPLKLQSYIDKFARQPLYHLESLHLNAPPDTLKSDELSSPGNKERSNSNFSIFANTNSFINNGTTNTAASNSNNNGKKLSFRTIKKSLSNLSLNSTASANGSNGYRHQRNSSIGSIVTMSDLAMTTNDPLLPSSRNNNSNNNNNSNSNINISYSDINTVNTDFDNGTTEADKENLSKFLESINKLNDNSVNDVIKIQEEFENNFLDTKASTSLREDLINILADPNSIYRHASKTDKKENADDNITLIDPTIQLEEQIPRRLQTKFGISVNKSLLSNIDLKKVVYKTGDNIPLNVSFLNNHANVTGLEIKLIQDLNIYREEYLSKNEYDEPSSYVTNKTHIETVLFEKLISTFNDDQLTLDILIPSNITSQFKTNFFLVKYILEIKFIFLKDRLVEAPVNSVIGENTTDSETVIATKPIYEKDKFELVPIFKDGKDQLLYKAVDYLPDAMATIVRLPVIILPNYEQDFGSVSKLS